MRATFHTLFLFGGFFVGAIVLSHIQRISLAMLKKMIGYHGMLAISAIGVVVHETGHLLMCWVFGHKVQKVRFFSPNQASGSLGYVNHSYNPDSFYQQIGNFFIGVGPIFSATLCLYLILFYGLNVDMGKAIEGVAGIASASISVQAEQTMMVTQYALLNLWAFVAKQPILGLVVVIGITSIAIHAAPSRSDMQGALKGSIVLLSFIIIWTLVASFGKELIGNQEFNQWTDAANHFLRQGEIALLGIMGFILIWATVSLIAISAMFILWKGVKRSL